MRHLNRPGLLAFAAAVILSASLMAGAYALIGPVRQTIENCLAIEALKAQLRPEPFDLANTKRILVDLNIDPQSETGKRLIESSRATNVRERARLAPEEC